MIGKIEAGVIATECLLAVRRMGAPWYRSGRPTKPAEVIIKRTMHSAARKVFPAGLSVLFCNRDEYESVYCEIVSAMFGILAEEGKMPKRRKKPETSACNARRSRRPLGREVDPVFSLFWKNEEGEEFGPWVPNPDSSEPCFGTDWFGRV